MYYEKDIQLLISKPVTRGVAIVCALSEGVSGQPFNPGLLQNHVSGEGGNQ